MATVEMDESTLKEISSLLAAVKDSATPGLAERISDIMVALGATMAEVRPKEAGRLVEATMDESDALVSTIQQLGDWERTGVLASVSEVAALVAALKDSATPAIAERLADLAVGLGQIAGEAGPGIRETVKSVEAHGNALAEMVEQLGMWRQDGTWDTLMEMVSLLRGLHDSITPQIVERSVTIATIAAQSLNDALDSGLLDLGVRTADALALARRDAANDHSKMSATGILRSLKDPEIQRGVKIVMALLRRLPQVIDG